MLAWGTSMNPRYPVYVISKGRWESRLTVRSLEAMRVPYHVVVEPQEFSSYASVIPKENILTLPFSNLGLGSIPARNWVWEHAISTGAARHWIMDDNIRGFYRLNRNFKGRATSGTIFRCAEDFVDRYENVPMAGLQYQLLCPAPHKYPAFNLNTRVYSCILLDNSIPHRWRGRYNEDTDLSLRILKDGYCTILFNAFLCGKVATLTMKGGNMETLYKGDGRRLMAESLYEQHPDVVTITWKWGRWQHHVNYKPFKGNKLILKPGVEPKDGIDEYGMVLRRIK